MPRSSSLTCGWWARAALIEEGESEVLGINVQPLSEEMRQQLGLSDDVQGLAVTDVAGDSEAYEKGIRSGDVITEGGTYAGNPTWNSAAATGRDAGAQNAEEDAGGAVSVTIRRPVKK